MSAAKQPPVPPPEDSEARDETGRKPSEEPETPTKIPPADRRIGEAPGHLRDREDAFKRRRGGKD
jgi:hypothetical protein